MKPLLIALLLAGAPRTQAADVSSATFYIQLIRGSDVDSPPEPQARLIGDKLDRRLHDTFQVEELLGRSNAKPSPLNPAPARPRSNVAATGS